MNRRTNKLEKYGYINEHETVKKKRHENKERGKNTQILEEAIKST